MTQSSSERTAPSPPAALPPKTAYPNKYTRKQARSAATEPEQRRSRGLRAPRPRDCSSAALRLRCLLPFSLSKLFGARSEPAQACIYRPGAHGCVFPCASFGLGLSHWQGRQKRGRQADRQEHGRGKELEIPRSGPGGRLGEAAGGAGLPPSVSWWTRESIFLSDVRRIWSLISEMSVKSVLTSLESLSCRVSSRTMPSVAGSQRQIRVK
ncbi:uncharacterized protein LOC134153516 [Rhea pennata]|uniref:uncharacterized protein LOC134153516 n=1 Tax=Rhea pennata TaxID=8795 RepID=UPI002E26E790